MARPLRIEYDGAFYHVIARGERREDIFTGDGDKEKFLVKLAETAEKFRLLIHAYVLMDNHYHLLVETSQANLGKAMHHLNASYSNWFCRKYQIVGSVFQGRYKAILVEKDEYLKMLSAYIHLNPVRAKIVPWPDMYRFSSMPYYAGKAKPPKFLHTQDLLALFSGKNAYQAFVQGYKNGGSEIEKSEVYGCNSLLGDMRFLRAVYAKLETSGRKIDEREQTDVRSAKQVVADDIIEVLLVDMRIREEDLWSRRRGNVYRKLLAFVLRRYTALTLKEIGAIMKMDYAAVSELARSFERNLEKEMKYQRLAKHFEKEISKRQLLARSTSVKRP
jgi:REP element-mobilizing transposase RayT